MACSEGRLEIARQIVTTPVHGCRSCRRAIDQHRLEISCLEQPTRDACWISAARHGFVPASRRKCTLCTFAVGTSCVFFVSCVSLAPFCYVSSLLAWGIVIAGISLTKLQKCEEPFLDLFFNRFTSELIFWFLFVFCVMTKLKLYEILF